MSLLYIVGPGYLKTMGIPLLRGRFLASSDDEHGERVVVIDDVFARKYFGAADPIGQLIHLENFDDPAIVVGVVGHVNQWGLDLDAGHSLRTEIYQSILQLPEVQLGLVPMGTDVVVSTTMSEQTAFKAIQNALAQMDRQQVAYNDQSMEAIIADTLAGRRFAMTLLSFFAGIALLLASIGMYGVISYLVGQRTQEIGIRIALGADRGDVLRWVLQRGSKLALIGAGAGLAIAITLTQLMTRSSSMSSMIYGIRAYDPWTLAGVTFVLLMVALAACCIPARRAMTIDPMHALRTE
jgi:predicted permease